MHPVYWFIYRLSEIIISGLSIHVKKNDWFLHIFLRSDKIIEEIYIMKGIGATWIQLIIPTEPIQPQPTILVIPTRLCPKSFYISAY